jgi:hypothetical protein
LYIIKRARGPCEKGRDGGRRGQAPLGHSFCFFFSSGLFVRTWNGSRSRHEVYKSKSQMVWRQDRTALYITLAKKFLPKRAEVLHFGACLFLAGALFKPNRGNIKGTDFLAQTRFSSCPISERQNPISCPLMWTINCARPRDRPCPVAGFHVRFFSLLLWSDPASPQLGDPVSHSRVLRSRALFLSPPPSLVCSFLVLPLREIK